MNGKTQHKGRGGSRDRGKIGTVRGNEKEEESTSDQGGRGGNNVAICRWTLIRRKGKYVITCYPCRVQGHKKYECLKGKNL